MLSPHQVASKYPWLTVLQFGRYRGCIWQELLPLSHEDELDTSLERAHFLASFSPFQAHRHLEKWWCQNLQGFLYKKAQRTLLLFERLPALSVHLGEYPLGKHIYMGFINCRVLLIFTHFNTTDPSAVIYLRTLIISLTLLKTYMAVPSIPTFGRILN